MTLGSRIREYRLKRGLTQSQIAEKLNMTESNFSSYERDKSVPPSEVLNKIADYLNVSTDYLLGRKKLKLTKIYYEEVTVGQRIKELRKEKRLTQQALAKYLDISQQAIVRWESGTSEPSSSKLAKLCQVFNVSSDYVLGLTENSLSNQICRTYEAKDESYHLVKDIQNLSPQNRALLEGIVNLMKNLQ
ncbi:helix-turn-helix domain-containing protein [Desulfitobacterium chlororespirans]|uniref:DNA-binding transcriptional regulator, XRE-family HTH domain n=1 Tax=Desulfitobacterium chlororespirans DSM 11544 TaxID=1121395 RepID=A0A1M7UY67_9FIRM|nr:helix-turn-helix transcriptional regulator [Desulfitobacterium chlororespirans]SHN87981.1 DNA-binding transcriptional regulator, XRE-family HTH domain [Desulfitobacterium chlororespirans DSM 11544]